MNDDNYNPYLTLNFSVFLALNPLSCTAYKNTNAVGQSQKLTIDVDGSGPLAPFPVTCEYYSKCQLDCLPNLSVWLCLCCVADGRILTLLGHNNEQTTRVDGYQEPGSFVQDITYDADMDQIEALLNRSMSCHQRLMYSCKRSKLLNSPSSGEHMLRGKGHKNLIVSKFLKI